MKCVFCLVMAFRDEMKRFADKSSAEQEKVQNEVLIRFNNLLHDRDQLKIKLDDVIETNDILNQSVTVLADSLSTDATQIENNSPSKSSNTVSFSSQTDFSVPRNEQALDQMCAILDGFPSRLSDEELLMVASLSRIQGEVDVRASQPGIFKFCVFEFF